ncbi:hypothetical protein C7S15_6091 [Burkholderia cepacia]|nr:hypothetical protein [Burkholderia cepacia]
MDTPARSWRAGTTRPARRLDRAGAAKRCGERRLTKET